MWHVEGQLLAVICAHPTALLGSRTRAEAVQRRPLLCGLQTTHLLGLQQRRLCTKQRSFRGLHSGPAGRR